MTYFMRDMRERRGELWLHISESELVWACAVLAELRGDL